MDTADNITPLYTHDLIVVGASAGGVEALSTLVSRLPADFPAAVLVVLHSSAAAETQLHRVLGGHGRLPAKVAEHGEPIQRGQIYVAPSDQHLLVRDEHILLSRGPHENRHRPAVDTLFRSAAVAYRSRCVGIVLSGYLDDGSAGLRAIKRCGGKAMVQDPDDAMVADMPASAARVVVVDYLLPVAGMGPVLARLAREPVEMLHEPPEEVVVEAGIAERVMSDIRSDQRLGQLVPVSCPECGGPLWQVDSETMERYRCHVGHAYTARALLADQDNAVEQALWVAMRTLEERANILANMAEREEQQERPRISSHLRERTQETRQHARVLRELIENHSRALAS